MLAKSADACGTRDSARDSGGRAKPLLKDRRLLSVQRAVDLSRLFKVLASETRLRLLHALCKNDQMCVSDLAMRLRMKPQAVSNQLQRLADLGVVARQREGNNINYTIGDCCMVNVLDYALCHSEDTRPRARR